METQTKPAPIQPTPQRIEEHRKLVEEFHQRCAETSKDWKRILGHSLIP